MTKFIDKTKESLVKNEIKETKFLKILEFDFSVASVASADPNYPKEYDTIEFIGHDIDYGDVFKAYDSNANEFTLFFGVKGDEFD